MKTVADINRLIGSFNIASLVWEETLDRWNFTTGGQVFSTRRGMLSLTMKSEGLSKYVSLTGKTGIDVDMDLTYHFLDNFSTLQSFNTLRARIKDPALCGSFATTVAVNKYIQANNSSEAEIKELLSGSKWRWVKLACGDYIQKTLYLDYLEGEYSYFRAENISSLFLGGMSCASLVNGKDILIAQAHRAEREVAYQREQEEARRRAAETELRGYSTRATDFFKFKKGKDAKYNTFLGIELELEGHSPNEFERCLNSIKEHAIFKRDGSLDAGVEICTAPATLDVHKEEFSKFFSSHTTNKSKLNAADSCGMHVHIDRSKLSNLHVANLCLLLNKPENEQHIQAIAGRSPNSYCKTREHKYYDFTSDNRGDRYQRVNLTPEKTVELRMFASTTDYADFCKRLEFTQAVVDYTRPGETNIPCKNIPNWDLFKGYVMKNRKVYPTLVKGL